MTLRADFTSQEYLRNPAGAIEKLRAAGLVVEVRFPFVGTVWTTTTQDLANQVLRDSEIFTLRKDNGDVVGLRWWMPKNRAHDFRQYAVDRRAGSRPLEGHRQRSVSPAGRA